MLLPCFFSFPTQNKWVNCIYVHAHWRPIITTLLINYINLSCSKRESLGAVVEKVLAYKHAHLWQIQKYSHGRARKSLPSMGKHLKGGGQGKAVASSVQWISLQNQTRANVQSVATATNTCSLFCNIAAKRQGKCCCAFYHSGFNKSGFSRLRKVVAKSRE